ncbi:MAG: 23S rRNA (guanosine(2251)-2'-O)-methyltransferase RlmB [Planctomicrobium sp.]|jgi:23S rRNA (guanosine2251-2'-O)-methyltransferase|nr:23S rRNA (guanosine(2251)-2'-O)-methyltransferase RlmB [Planctomicrobium sp.]
MSTVRLMNPHSVLAVLEHRPQDVMEVHASTSKSSDAWKHVAATAKNFRISVREPIARNNRKSRQADDSGRVGTTYAIVREKPAVTLDELFADESKRGVWLALDRLQDPHNVGAVFRTAGFFGIKGIILTQDKSAPITGTVYDTAAGGVETVPIVLQTNLVRALEVAKKSDMWVLGSSEHAEMSLAEVDRDRRWLVVIGNEEKGLRRLTQENCDQICQIPPVGNVTSLNVSVAAGIMMSTLTAK